MARIKVDLHDIFNNSRAIDQALQQALATHQGSRAALARQLGISERSLYRRLKALGA